MMYREDIETLIDDCQSWLDTDDETLAECGMSREMIEYELHNLQEQLTDPRYCREAAGLCD